MYKAQHRYAVTLAFIPSSVPGVIVDSALMHLGTLVVHWYFTARGPCCRIVQFDPWLSFALLFLGTRGSGDSDPNTV